MVWCTLVNTEYHRHTFDTQVTSLPPPWGTCQEDAPAYHTCQANCRHLKVANRCGCKDVYMSELPNGKSHVITLPKNYYWSFVEKSILDGRPETGVFLVDEIH